MEGTGAPADSRIWYFYGETKALPDPGGKSGKTAQGYRYRCYFGEGETRVFVAHAFRKALGAGIYIMDREERHQQWRLKLRGSFPLTGKIDLIDCRTKALCGIVTRGRKVYDREERLICRFTDTRTWRDHLGGSAVDIAGSILFGDDGAPTASGGTSFVLEHQGAAAGALARKQLPFFPDPPKRTEPGRVGKLMKKVLPTNLGQALIDITPPVGWRLEIGAGIEESQRFLILCGALMTIEIQRW